MTTYGPHNDRVRMYYRGDYLATLQPDGYFIRWKVTNFEADDPADAEATGIAATKDVAWECATTAVLEMRSRRSS